LPDGWQSVAENGKSLIVFGEQHGTNEGPAFVSDVACGLAKSGEKVAIAIEWDIGLSDDLRQAFLKPQGDFSAELRKLRNREKVDGTTSIAMLQLLSRMHELKSRGYEIELLTFSGFESEEQFNRLSALTGQNPIEAAYAENIQNEIQGRNYDYIIVLVGNLHAMKIPLSFKDMSIIPMTARLEAIWPTISLNMAYASGSAWNCQRTNAPENDVECKSHPIEGTADFDRAPFVQLMEADVDSDEKPFDGIFWVGPVSASSPPTD
jgi:hypothetical protein